MDAYLAVSWRTERQRLNSLIYPAERAVILHHLADPDGSRANGLKCTANVILLCCRHKLFS